MSTSVEVSKTSKLSYNDITEPQQKLIDRLYAGHCLAIAGVGFGKAVCAQTAAQELLEEGVVSRVIVFAPLKVCQLTWQTEWEKWSHLRRPGFALGDAWARSCVVENKDYDIVIMNFENMVWFLDKYGSMDFDGLVIDEVSKLKSAGSAMVKKLRRFTGNFQWRVGLSATPVAENPVDIYAQALVIDPTVLGTRLDHFMNDYFRTTDYNGYNWELLPGASERLAVALAPLVYVAEDTGYLESLPPLIDERVEVELPPAAAEAYKEMATEMLIESIEGGLEAANSAVMMGKLQQIAAGAVYDATGYAVWQHDRKTDALVRTLMNCDGPALIMYQFQFELNWLRELWPDLVVLGDDPEAAERAWNLRQLDMMAIHPKSAAHGLNLQHGGHELICLGPCWSADQWAQVVGRLRRRGQAAGAVKRTTIIAKGTVDEVILARLGGKSGSEADLMQHIKNAAR